MPTPPLATVTDVIVPGAGVLVNEKLAGRAMPATAAVNLKALPAKSIGHIGGGKMDRTGCVDVAVIQSLYRKDEVKDFVAEYGQVIVDECHHISAFTFEQV